MSFFFGRIQMARLSQAANNSVGHFVTEYGFLKRCYKAVIDRNVIELRKSHLAWSAHDKRIRLIKNVQSQSINEWSDENKQCNWKLSSTWSDQNCKHYVSLIDDDDTDDNNEKNTRSKE